MEICPECGSEWDMINNRCKSNCQTAEREIVENVEIKS